METIPQYETPERLVSSDFDPRDDAPAKQADYPVSHDLFGRYTPTEITKIIRELTPTSMAEGIGPDGIPFVDGVFDDKRYYEALLQLVMASSYEEIGKLIAKQLIQYGAKIAGIDE
jgi:hypothetical protein